MAKYLDFLYLFIITSHSPENKLAMFIQGVQRNFFHYLKYKG